MHPFSVLTLGIFVAGYITARWDLVTRLYELAIFAWDHGVVVCLPSAIGPLLRLRLYRLGASARYIFNVANLLFRHELRRGFCFSPSSFSSSSCRSTISRLKRANW